MQEFINQYGKTVVTYTLFAILIAILIGGSVFGLKGLLYVQGEKADEAAYIEEYQTDEDGKIKMDENGNKIKQNNDVKYITDTNGQTIAIADTDDFADNLDSALNKYSNLSINTKTSSFADSNSLSFGEENSIFNGTIDINNRRYNIGKEFNENTDTVGSTIIINYIKCRNLYNENDVNNTILITDSARSENLLLDNNVNDKYNGYTYIKRDTTDLNNDEILYTYKCRQIKTKFSGKNEPSYNRFNLCPTVIIHISRKRSYDPAHPSWLRQCRTTVLTDSASDPDRDHQYYHWHLDHTSDQPPTAQTSPYIG